MCKQGDAASKRTSGPSVFISRCKFLEDKQPMGEV